MKRVLITGVSGGLGAAMAREFRRRGWHVIGVCRTAPAADLCDEFIPCDLTDPAAVARLGASVETLDVLVNNAGIGAYAAWEELDDASLRKLMEIDFFAPVALTKSLLPALARTRGAVINISSVAAEVPVACMGAYNAAKAALAMFSESLRPELHARGIRVLTVLPGRIDTGFSKRAVGGRQVPETPGRTASSAEGLARRVYRAFVRRRRRLIYPAWYAPAIAFIRHFPAVNEYFNRKLWGLNRE